MKRILFFIGAVFIMLPLVVSCAAAPAPVEAPPPVAAPPPPPPPAPPPQAQPGPVYTPAPVPEPDVISSLSVGDFTVHMLVDSERNGGAGITGATDVFLIRAPGRNILVGSEFGSTIFERMEQLGVRPQQIDAVLLTHVDVNHIGSLHQNGQPLFPRAAIHLDRRGYDHFINNVQDQAAVAALNAYGGNVVVFDAVPLGFVYREILSGIRAIAYFGHTPGYTVFMLVSGRERLLVTGDFFL